MQRPSLFKKGQSGNPKGRPTLPADLVALRRNFTRELVEATFIKYLNMSLKDLHHAVDLKNNSNAALLPALDHIIIKIIAKAGIEGDQQRLTFLLDRTIGKVIDKTENHDYRINLNQQLDAIPKDKLISLLKESSEESYIDIEVERSDV